MGLCDQGKLDDLLTQLAAHRLDVVLSDEPASSSAVTGVSLTLPSGAVLTLTNEDDRFRLEREVSQLNFDDFTSSSQLVNTGALLAGNPDLSPQQAWVVEAAYEQHHVYPQRHKKFAQSYEMLAGQNPFSGRTDMQVLHNVRSGRVLPPSRLVPGLPQRLYSFEGGP